MSGCLVCGKSLRTDNKSGVCSKHWSSVRAQADRAYYEANRENIDRYRREWRAKNKERLNNYSREWLQKPENRLAHNLRTRLRKYILRAIESGRAPKQGAISGHTGIEWSDLKMYFESKFYSHPVTNEDMTWQNMGKYWQIDHILPLCSFDFNDPEAKKLANHYTNLRPLWREENAAKIKEDRRMCHRIQKQRS